MVVGMDDVAWLEAMKRSVEEHFLFPPPERGHRFWTAHYWLWLFPSYRKRLQDERDVAVKEWRESGVEVEFTGIKTRYADIDVIPAGQKPRGIGHSGPYKSLLGD